MYKNKELVDGLIQIIEDSPSIFIEEQLKEQNFVNLFKDKEEHQFLGIVRDYPLVVNMFADVLYDRVISKGVVEGLSSSNKFEIFIKDNLNYAGSWYRIANDIKEIEEFDRNASPIPTKYGRKGVVYSNEIERKLIQFTFSTEQLMTAFESEYGLSELLASEMKSVRDTINIHINGLIKGLILDEDNFKQFNFTEGTNGISPNALSYLEFGGNFNFDDSSSFAAQERTIQAIKRAILTYATFMSEPSRDYNIGDTDGGFMRNIPLGEGVLVLNNGLLNALNITADELFGSESNWKKYFKEIITTDLKISDGKYGLFAILDSNSIEVRYVLDKTLSWENPKALYTNYFTHVWYGYLVNPFLNGLLVYGED